MEIRVIGDRDTVTGFRLAGAFGFHVMDREAAKAALDRCTADEKVGLIIITNHWAHLLETELEEIRRKRTVPLIVEIPSRHGSVEVASQAEKAKRLIGIAPG